MSAIRSSLLFLFLLAFLRILVTAARRAGIAREVFLLGFAFTVGFGDFRADGKVGGLYRFFQAADTARSGFRFGVRRGRGALLTASMLEDAQGVADAFRAHGILGGRVGFVGDGNRQFNFYMKQKTAYKNNLIALIDQTYPGANSYFESPARSDGSQKWVDFVTEFWHVDCVRNLSLASFADKYMEWCKEHKYNFQPSKPAELMEQAENLIVVFPKDNMTKMFIQQAIDQLNAISKAVEELRKKMNELAMELPEYPAVIAMNGVGTTLGPQLMAEIGDVSRFAHRGALTAYAGVDPGANESGDKAQKSNKTSKAGSPHLRKTLFQIVDGLLQRSPEDDPVYCFMDKKRSEGKPYYVYMTAGANKFLRIY